MGDGTSIGLRISPGMTAWLHYQQKPFQSGLDKSSGKYGHSKTTVAPPKLLPPQDITCWCNKENSTCKNLWTILKTRSAPSVRPIPIY
eukprot:14558329-Ditylum_brightwellii.AAC.1